MGGIVGNWHEECMYIGAGFSFSLEVDMFTVFCTFFGGQSYLWVTPAEFTYGIKPAVCVSEGQFEYCAVKFN